MRRPTLLLLTTLAACSGDPDVAAARSTFERFQQALQQGDRTACRNLLTTGSAPALAALPWQDVARRQPLQILSAERGLGDFRVHVADPNDGGRRGEFVVVREWGRFAVDLVASAGLTAEEIVGPGSHDVLAPHELTPADLDRIHQHELAQPPK